MPGDFVCIKTNKLVGQLLKQLYNYILSLTTISLVVGSYNYIFSSVTKCVVVPGRL